MLRQLPRSLRTAARASSARPSYRQFASNAAPSNTLRVNIRRGAWLAAFSLAGAGTALFLQTREPISLDAQPLNFPSDLDAIRTDSATGIQFPETLTIPSRVRLPPFQLVGLGVRTVSFLRIKVYSIAFYADLASLKIPENLTPDEKINYIVSNTACVLRIIPTRNTSFSHLRDGFIRAIQAVMSAQMKSGVLSAQEAEEAQSPLRKLKSMFPNSPLKKGEPLDIMLLPPPKTAGENRTLVVRDLGSVESNWLAKEFILAYFGGDGLSPPMKKSVVEFLQSSPASLIQ